MPTTKDNLIIQDINWNIYNGLSIFSLQIYEDILKINLKFDNTTTNKLIQIGSLNGDISFKDANDCISRGLY